MAKKRLKGKGLAIDGLTPAIPARTVPATSAAVMTLNEAVLMVKGLDEGREKWKAFDAYVERSSNRKEGYTKESIIKGLVLFASGATTQYITHKDAVNGAIELLEDDSQRLVERKFSSIKSLISMAYNNKAKAKSKPAVSAEKTEDVADVISAEFGKVEANYPVYLKTLTDSQLETLSAMIQAEKTARIEAATSKAASKAA